MQNHSNHYPALKRPYKGVYPFKLGTTSFIYPDHYIPNVKMLGPYFDEIELLLFESLPPDVLPGSAVITELAHLAEAYDLSYNVHLPTDISITDPDPSNQKRAIDTILDIIDLTSPLSPSGYALHIPYNSDSFGTETVKKWQNQALSNLKKILAAGIPPDLIWVETLDYPYELLTDIICESDLNICLDLGHLMMHGYDIKSAFNAYGAKTAMIHLHGFINNRDHLDLNALSDDDIEPVLWILRQFTRTVTLEVFSFEELQASLAFLEKHWKSYDSLPGYGQTDSHF
jgi:sugar phosphate isomerase/epimerase